ncbi:MAG: RluA family pseudouridine synthase [Rickettsiales bacterium]|jgi:23S rRNA pseudouridine955/2504/2580 synthase|nr:RluA family pseudouridine synthase [Rickettsiales bacterium]
MAHKIKIAEDRIKISGWMKKNYPSLGMAHLQKLCRIGEIRLNGSRAAATEAMVAGDELKIPPYLEEYKAARTPHGYTADDAKDFARTAVYEDKDIIAVNKPAGISSQGGTGMEKHMDELANFARPDLRGNARLVHRLDKDTSGVLVIAKNYDAARAMGELFKTREIKKTYLALAYGNLKAKEGTIRAPILEGPDGPRVSEARGAKRAVTKFKVMDEAFGKLSLVRLEPETGRMHQLRLHMAHIGHPIVGDFKYGRQGEFARLKETLDIDRRLYLHAHSIEIPGKRKITAGMPEHMERICKFLNFGMKK